MTLNQRVVSKAKIPVEEHQWFLDLPQMMLLVFQRRGNDKQAVHVARHQGFDQLIFVIHIVVSTADHQLVARTAAAQFEFLGERCKEHVRDVGHDESQRLGFV